jgi:hypothetical protein
MNSQRSSGPKTESGKRASSRNAIKHGVFVSETISHETITKLRRTMDGIDFVRGCVKTVRTEVEKRETLSETNLGLLLDCLGTSGLDLLGITEYDEELEKEDLEMVLAFLDHQISILNAQEQFLQTALESESSAALQSLCLASPVAANNLLRYEAHLDRKLCRDTESLERRQAERKKVMKS